jgi:uncharacterized protein YcgI (DUF1989 family)
MTSLRRAAAATTLALAALVAAPGCQQKQAPAPADAGIPSADRVAAARAAYAAKGDMLVGQVDDANERFAAVSGIETTAVKKGDVFTFIDINGNRAVNHGTLNDTSASGRLIVEFDPQGERAPRTGDLCVKLK